MSSQRRHGGGAAGPGRCPHPAQHAHIHTHSVGERGGAMHTPHRRRREGLSLKHGRAAKVTLPVFRGTATTAMLDVRALLLHHLPSLSSPVCVISACPCVCRPGRPALPVPPSIPWCAWANWTRCGRPCGAIPPPSQRWMRYGHTAAVRGARCRSASPQAPVCFDQRGWSECVCCSWASPPFTAPPSPAEQMSWLHCVTLALR